MGTKKRKTPKHVSAEVYDPNEKKPYTFRFRIGTMDDLQKLADVENRTLTNYLENIFSIFVKSKKKK